MLIRMAIFLAGTSIMAGQPGIASRLSSPSSLDRLLDTSNSAVIGTIASVTLSGTQVSVSLVVDRTIKGALEPTQLLFVDWNIPNLSLTNEFRPTVYEGVTSLWFLSLTSDNRWQPLPIIRSGRPNLPDFFLRVSGTPPAPGMDSPHLRLLKEIANTIENGGTSPWLPFFLDGLVSSLGASPALVELYLSFTASPSSEIEAAGIAGLVSLGLPSGYDLLASYLLQAQSSSASERIVVALCNAPRGNQDVERLIELTKTKDPRLARCAAVVLQAIHSPATLSRLAELLEHPVQEMRFLAVAGLAAFANNRPVQEAGPDPSMRYLTRRPGPAPYAPPDGASHSPSMDTFEKNEAEFTGFWKDWWAKNRIAILEAQEPAQ